MSFSIYFWDIPLRLNISSMVIATYLSLFSSLSLSLSIYLFLCNAGATIPRNSIPYKVVPVCIYIWQPQSMSIKAFICCCCIEYLCLKVWQYLTIFLLEIPKQFVMYILIQVVRLIRILHLLSHFQRQNDNYEFTLLTFWYILACNAKQYGRPEISDFAFLHFSMTLQHLALNILWCIALILWY